MKPKVKKTLENILSLVLPIVMVYEVTISKRSKWKKVIYVVACLLLMGWIYKDAIVQTSFYASSLLLELGVVDKPIEVSTSGPSMLPTLKEQDKVMLSNPKKVGIDRGDIVTFSNDETEGLAYIKRVVGLPGESITVKQGAVWVNGKPLKEPYIYQNRPTFGNTFLDECTEKIIPLDSFAVMGDNRGVSWDSRAIGFIKKDDIKGVRKDKQTEFYTDSAKLVKFTQKEFDEKALIRAINARRSDEKVNPLITNLAVDSAATMRSKSIVADFLGYKAGSNSVEKTLENGNYRYNLLHEYITFGYLDAEEVAAQIFDNASEQNLFLSDRFTEVGVGITDRTVGACTYPVISVVLSWPSVATYDKETVNSWARDASLLLKNVSNYQTWVGFPEKDQVKLRELIDVSSQMAVIASRIHTRMVDREYLTTEDYSDIKRYNNTLLPRENQLYADLFGGSVQGAQTTLGGTKENW